MSKVRMYEAKTCIYEPYEYYIHSSLEAKQSHNIKRANEASCDVHIFVDRERNIDGRFSFLPMQNLGVHRNVKNCCCFTYIFGL